MKDNSQALYDLLTRPVHTEEQMKQKYEDVVAQLPIWYSVKQVLPEDGQWVLVHYARNNWGDQPEPYIQNAQFVRGISLEEREQMKRGELPDPQEGGYTYPDGNGAHPVLSYHKRSDSWHGEDEGFNNERSFHWVQHGPGSLFGQDVDFWMPLPQPPYETRRPYHFRKV